MVKKKWFYCPPWRVDEVEKRLNDLERNGFRVAEIYGFPPPLSIATGYLLQFRFQPSKGKNADYFIAYCPLDTRSSIPPKWDFLQSEYRYRLVNDHTTNPVPEKNVIIELFRITGENRNYSTIKRMRAYHNKLLCRQSVFLSLFMLVCGAYFGLVAFLNNIFSLKSPLYIALMSASFLFFLHSLYGYVVQAKKCKTMQVTKREFEDFVREEKKRDREAKKRWRKGK